MIKTTCVECGKTILWDGHGPVKYTCDECREEAGEFSKIPKKSELVHTKMHTGSNRCPDLGLREGLG